VIHELMSDPELRKEMGEKGQQLAASSYTWDIAGESHVKLFERCLNRMDF
jgi:glycosyltransferase involved in cell wall biosynthesis